MKKRCMILVLSLLVQPALVAAANKNSGVQVHDANKVDRSYRFYSTEKTSTAHLISPEGRYAHSWHFILNQEGTKHVWQAAEMQPNGHLIAVFEDSIIVEIDWQSKLVRRDWLDRQQRAAMASRVDTTALANGNRLINAHGSGRLIEVAPSDSVVWEYLNPDVKSDGTRQDFCAVRTYPAAQIDSLLNLHGGMPVDYLAREIRQTRRLRYDTRNKKVLREAVFQTEARYLDKALNIATAFSEASPDDPEAEFIFALVHAQRRNHALARDHIERALDADLPVERFLSGLGGLLGPLHQDSLFQKQIGGLDGRLIHGPMLGNIGEASASIWARISAGSQMHIEAHAIAEPKKIFRSQQVLSAKKNDLTVVVALDGLQPQTAYAYRILVDGRLASGPHQFVSAARVGAPAQFRVLFGGGAGYNPQYERVWDSLRVHQAPLMLLLGDNVYIDHPERPHTQRYCYERRQSRPEFRRFSAETALYAIWDDHDFTYNDGKGSPEIDTPYWKKDVWQLFRSQWNNPAYGGGEQQPGCWFQFSYGDVDFFMLDTRYYREEPTHPKAAMLGMSQKKWLFAALSNSNAKFKVIASSVPFAEKVKPGSKDTWDGHPDEREEIYAFLESNNIDGVIILSADRHRSDAYRISRPNGYDLYEFSSSRLSNVHVHMLMPHALMGYNKKPSYGLLEFDTTAKNPYVRYKIFSIDNEEIHRFTLYHDQIIHRTR